MKPILLFNLDTNMETCEGVMELDVAREHFPCVTSRILVPENSLVVARFGLLPFYEEMVRDLALTNSRLLNTYAQHQWIAGLMAWGGVNGILAGMTPPSWTQWGDLPEGAYVVKGRTNSKKHSWNSRMFAPTRSDVAIIASRLLEDDRIQDQGLVARAYVPLKKLDEGLNDLPITNEWRVFFLVTETDGKKEVHRLAHGFYWMGSHPEAAELASIPEDVLNGFVMEAAERVKDYASFFVLDFAQAEDGHWLVIEVNDGQMSGLCGVRAADLYSNLARVLGCPTKL